MFRRNVHYLRRQVYKSTDGQTTLKTKAVRAFETSGSNHPTRRRTDSDRLQKMKSFSAVPFPATPVVLSAALCCLSLACYTSDKQVRCYYGRCTRRLISDLALQQMSYTICIQQKAILSGVGGGRRRNADCLSFSIEKEVIPSVSVVLATQRLETLPKKGNRTHFQNIMSSQVIILSSGCSFCLLFCTDAKHGRSY